MQSKENLNSKEKILQLFEQSIHNKQDLLNSSINKDIIIFLGNTGSGKSTLINYLANKNLEVIDPILTPIGTLGGKIILNDPYDQEALKIGSSTESETLFPQYIKVLDAQSCTEILLFDFPGFGDTRGFEVNILNAYFTQKIIQAANSVKIAFICSYDEIKAERGKSFNQLLTSAESLFGELQERNFIIFESSCLIITKTVADLQKTILEIKPYVRSNLIESWIGNNRIAVMPLPFNSLISEKEKPIILNLISKSLKKGKVNSIDLSSIIKDKEKNIVEKLLKEEINQIESDCYEKVNSNLKMFSTMKGFLEAKKAFDQFFSLKPQEIFKFKKFVVNKLAESQLIQILYSSIESIIEQIQKECKEIFKNKQIFLIDSFNKCSKENISELSKIKVTRHVGSSYGSDCKSNYLNDSDYVKNGEPITGWEIGHGGGVDSIKFKYGDIWGHIHGGPGGRKDFVLLNPGERIISAFVNSGFAVYQLILSTSQGRKFAYGKGGGWGKNETINFNSSLAYITSRSGNWYFYTFEYLVSSLSFFEAPFR